MSAEPVSRPFISARLQLHLLDWGNDAAPPLILIHGGEDHARSLDGLARALRPDWHVVAPDLRGHGDSAWTSDGVYSAPSFVLDLFNLVASLGDGPVRLVGHSLGGAIALRFAGIYPERVQAVVAIEGVGHTPPKLRQKLDQPAHLAWSLWIEEQRALAIKPRRVYASIEEAEQRLRAANPMLTAAMVQHLTRFGVRPVPGGVCWKHDPAIRSFLPVDLSMQERVALWARIACPVLLLHGQLSWASDPVADGTLAHFVDARVLSVPDAGHWLHHDQPQLVTDAIVAFLRSA